MDFDFSKKILVAEDSPHLRKVLVNIVKKIGFQEIVEAEDGQQAWEKIEAGGVGLVLTDWNMPRMSGLDLVEKIRSATSVIKEIPILMITASDTKDSIVTAGKKGVDAYIIKPFSVSTIKEKIEEAFNARAGS